MLRLLPNHLPGNEDNLEQCKIIDRHSYDLNKVNIIINDFKFLTFRLQTTAKTWTQRITQNNSRPIFGWQNFNCKFIFFNLKM